MPSIPKSLSADDFNIYFNNVPKKVNDMFANEPVSLLWKGLSSNYEFNFCDVSHEALLTELKSLPSNSGLDIMKIDQRLLKTAGPYISRSLLRIINESLKSGVVHDDWKVARVTPVYKNDGDVENVNNYRPISVIGHVAKIMEKLVRIQLVNYLEIHHFISPDQSAYLKHHSTQSCLHRVIEDWLEGVNDNLITGACLLDISKCFDTINHELLLMKLRMYGITGRSHEWFSSYLNNRRQAVNCNGVLSTFLNIESGVPQGSVLGPFLFLLFINDVANFSTYGCVTNLYADDTIIYTSGSTIEEVKSRLQSCLDSICNWYHSNRLHINIKKCKTMLIGTKSQLRSLNLDDFLLSYDSNPMEVVNNAKYLGLFISSDITWDAHVNYMCRQLNYMLSMLRRMSKIFPQSLLVKIYKTFIQPKIDYGITVWGFTTESNLNRIQRIQNHAVRIILKNFDYVNTRGIDLVRHLGLFDIRSRRDYFMQMFMFKAIHGLTPHYISDCIDMNFDVNGYNTRSSNTMNVHLPTPRKEIYKNGFIYSGGKTWNALPSDVKESTNIESFRRNLRQFYYSSRCVVSI